ncbi:uncharacterized protein MYCGRDRAFT_96645 [Zymoseptoria tritici IPO323]|uniref:Uncharacterized protein n=1 Tax=Zymoseptoria tritici (strain CBS 115943 / IPO323) TaxID=336722 RepID=F9XN19_ZYMTI|nr:uncharacterized protein MYCGRDRAFT_96645 [Zymoseptoria tritici IPO323]EGP83591.1 hypothetical protein MYCGRDRAFT_96645 [Zymoseptoria tritici IPO323]
MAFAFHTQPTPSIAKSQSQFECKPQSSRHSQSPSDSLSKSFSKTPTVVYTLVAPGEQLHLLAYLQPNILPRTFRNLSLFDLPQEIQEIIYANLITGAATSTTPTSFMASCHRALYYARKILIPKMVLVSNFHMGIWPADWTDIEREVVDIPPLPLGVKALSVEFYVEESNNTEDVEPDEELSQDLCQYLTKQALNGLHAAVIISSLRTRRVTRDDRALCDRAVFQAIAFHTCVLQEYRVGLW